MHKLPQSVCPAYAAQKHPLLPFWGNLLCGNLLAQRCHTTGAVLGALSAKSTNGFEAQHFLEVSQWWGHEEGGSGSAP